MFVKFTIIYYNLLFLYIVSIKYIYFFTRTIHDIILYLKVKTGRRPTRDEEIPKLLCFVWYM